MNQDEANMSRQATAVAPMCMNRGIVTKNEMTKAAAAARLKISKAVTRRPFFLLTQTPNSIMRTASDDTAASVWRTVSGM